MFRFRAKVLKNKEGYRDNLTSFERIAAEIWTFYKTGRFSLIKDALRFEMGSDICFYHTIFHVVSGALSFLFHGIDFSAMLEIMKKNTLLVIVYVLAAVHVVVLTLLYLYFDQLLS